MMIPEWVPSVDSDLRRRQWLWIPDSAQDTVRFRMTLPRPSISIAETTCRDDLHKYQGTFGDDFIVRHLSCSRSASRKGNSRHLWDRRLAIPPWKKRSGCEELGPNA
mmetsp:Transcript_174921/g.560901  ORF Transcript_174921/g.560901 Transcript_174921/m.560901 type:complete len:107 (+) Transcript_174921:4164-4484(+)